MTVPTASHSQIEKAASYLLRKGVRSKDVVRLIALYTLDELRVVLTKFKGKKVLDADALYLSLNELRERHKLEGRHKF